MSPSLLIHAAYLIPEKLTDETFSSAQGIVIDEHNVKTMRYEDDTYPTMCQIHYSKWTNENKY